MTDTHKLGIGMEISAEWWQIATAKETPETHRDLRVFPATVAPDLDNLAIAPEGLTEKDLIRWLKEGGWPNKTLAVRIYIGGTYRKQQTFSASAGKQALWGGVKPGSGEGVGQQILRNAYTRFCESPTKFADDLGELAPAFEKIKELGIKPLFGGLGDGLFAGVIDKIGPYIERGIAKAMHAAMTGGQLKLPALPAPSKEPKKEA